MSCFDGFLAAQIRVRMSFNVFGVVSEISSLFLSTSNGLQPRSDGLQIEMCSFRFLPDGPSPGGPPGSCAAGRDASSVACADCKDSRGCVVVLLFVFFNVY